MVWISPDWLSQNKASLGHSFWVYYGTPAVGEALTILLWFKSRDKGMSLHEVVQLSFEPPGPNAMNNKERQPWLKPCNRAVLHRQVGSLLTFAWTDSAATARIVLADIPELSCSSLCSTFSRLPWVNAGRCRITIVSISARTFRWC